MLSLLYYKQPNFKHMTEKHKSGFVNIVGNPNVGKSTLMNDLVGERGGSTGVTRSR